jgi:hypothetical protein
MKSEVNRRVFVGSMVAGLPLLASQTGVLAQTVGGMAHEHLPAASPADPVIDYIVRQIGRIHNAARSGPRGEHARALAAQLRTLAVYERQLGFDAQVRAGLQELVEREGRDTVLYTEPDLAMRRQHLEAYGFQLNDRLLDVPLAPTYGQRDAALGQLLAEGITPTFDRLATFSETVAARLDRSNRRLVTIGQDGDWWAGFCVDLWNEYQQAQLIAAPFCMLAKYMGFILPGCLALEGGAMVLLVVYLVDCSLW